MRSRFLAVILVAMLLSASVRMQPARGADAQSMLSSHYVPGWGFRDELNTSDIDYQNFWTDNAGKILTAGVITNDVNNSNRALGFITDHLTKSYYLPEALVNSSIFNPDVGNGSSSITNRIVQLTAVGPLPDLQKLSIGEYYASPWTAGYLGAYRIWYNGSAHRALSVNVTLRPDGYAEKAYFSFGGLSFYTYLNATIAIGDPFVKVSLQVQPINSPFLHGDYVDLQVFARSLEKYSFENATMFDASGSKTAVAPFNNAVVPGRSTMVIAYSNRTSVFDQDAVALEFNTTSVSSIEHWYKDSPFDKLSWLGLGYNFPSTRQGELSRPVYANVYPIEHLDYRLLSDTAKYIASHPKDVAVAPPVSFGFVARGLALASNLAPGNQTLRKLAEGYWKFYYARYDGTQPTTAYARAASLFTIAGFELYSGNATENVTVERFAREFVEANRGSSIEESGWAAAALQTLYLYTKSNSDLQFLRSANDSIVPDVNHYLRVIGSNNTPSYTFQFAEAAAGLLSAGSSYNNPSVLWAMNAVFASNSSGILLNSPRHGDLANTETIPAYMLSMWLFKNAMRSYTGYWIDWVQNANIAALDYRNGHLEVDVSGKNGSLALGTPDGIVVYHDINGSHSYPTPQCPWALLEVGAAVIGAVLLVVGYFFLRKTRPQQPTSLQS
jgi:hypothetical protein